MALTPIEIVEAEKTWVSAAATTYCFEHSEAIHCIS
jgi:hypothetical protein